MTLDLPNPINVGRSDVASGVRENAAPVQRLLFLDGTVMGIEQAQELDRTLGAGWKVTHALDAAEAGALLKTEAFAAMVVRSDDPTPALPILEAALAKDSHMAVVLCSSVRPAASPAPAAVRCVPTAAAPVVIADRVLTAHLVSKWEANSSLSAVLAHFRRVPVLPSIYAKLTAEMQKPDADVERVASLISKEPTVCARVLQFANSSALALRQRVATPGEAIMFLGLARVRALVLVSALFSEMDVKRQRMFSAERFITHSLQVASLAASICRDVVKERTMADMAFTAGLLHDFGMLLLAENLADSYDQVLTQSFQQMIPVEQIERDTYGVTHGQIAGATLANWMFPHQIVHAVGYHHQPSESGDFAFCPLAAVHIASTCARAATTGTVRVDDAYILRLGLGERVSQWVSQFAAERSWAG